MKDKNKDLGFWLNEYYQKFNDYFPTENFSCSEEEMIEEIKKYIQMGATFEEMDIKSDDVKY